MGGGVVRAEINNKIKMWAFRIFKEDTKDKILAGSMGYCIFGFCV